MADQSQILREYLIALGVQVNETEAKKFDGKLTDWDKKVNVLGKSLLGVGVAVAGMVSAFAYQMDKLYFASKRTDAAAGNIQALEFAGKQVGVGGDAMRNALEGMARALRSQPGLYGLLENLGVPVKGRDKADVLTDLVTQLNKMPTFMAERYANMFGIDPDTLYMIRQAGDEYKKAIDERKRMAAEAGLDTEAAAKAGHEYANTWREIIERADILKDVILLRLLPTFQDMAKETDKMLVDLSQIVALPYDQIVQKLMDQLPSWEKFKARFFNWDNPDFKDKGGVELSPDSRKRLGLPADESNAQPKGRASERWARRAYSGFMKWAGAKGYDSQDGDEASIDAAQDTSQFKKGGTGGDYGTGGHSTTLSKEQIDALFARLEKQYNLTPGTLDRIWKAESNRGDPKFMLSSAGAKGHFGLMDATAHDMGVSDPNDLAQSAEGSAKYFAKQKARFGTDQLAAGAYNDGPDSASFQSYLKTGNLGVLPKETQDYMGKVAPIHQENNITVNGVSDPQKAADAVGDSMQDANADLIRNQRVKVY